MKTRNVVVMSGMILVLVVGGVWGAEPGQGTGKSSNLGWHQWRGSHRNGVAADSPALVEKIPEQGLKKLWESESLSGTAYSGVVVANGRAFVQSYLKYNEPIQKRVLTGKAFNGMGWVPDMPEDMVKAVEAARVSEERTKLKGKKPLRKWVAEWIKTQAKPEWQKFNNILKVRLLAGVNALPLDVLAKLDTIKDKEFANQADLDAWFDTQGFDKAARDAIMKSIVTAKTLYADILYCLDADTGKTLWKVQRPGVATWRGSHPTPCAYGDRSYMFGSSMVMFCMDVKDGKEIWKSEPLAREIAKRKVIGASPLWVDGAIVIINDTNLVALDAETGKVRWRQAKIKGRDSSPVPWEVNGKTHILCIGKELTCVDVKSGDIVWSVAAAGGGGSLTVVEDIAVVTGKSVIAFKLSADKAEQIWSVPFVDGYASPLVHEGHVYVIGGGYTKKGQARCFELASGKEIWKEMISTQPQLSSPLLADGKVVAQVGASIYLLKASPKAYTLLGEAKVGCGKWSSPSMDNGRLFVRGSRAYCYDLTAN